MYRIVGVVLLRRCCAREASRISASERSDTRASYHDDRHPVVISRVRELDARQQPPASRLVPLALIPPERLAKSLDHR
jgi:hypothetical protein